MLSFFLIFILERKENMIENLIGNTPMVKIKYRYQNKENYVYAKLVHITHINKAALWKDFLEYLV